MVKKKKTKKEAVKKAKKAKNEEDNSDFFDDEDEPEGDQESAGQTGVAGAPGAVKRPPRRKPNAIEREVLKTDRQYLFSAIVDNNLNNQNEPLKGTRRNVERHFKVLEDEESDEDSSS